MKEKVLEIAAAAFLAMGVFTISSGATGAFLTSAPAALSNLITFGEIKVKLTESMWREENAQHLPAGSVTAKNPAVTNTGKNDAWIFLRVSVPIRETTLVDKQSGRKTASVRTALFRYVTQENWQKVDELCTDTEYIRVYGYRTLVRPAETTTPLFESVTLADYLEGELTAGDDLQMLIKAMAVQDHVTEEGKGLVEIYKTYVCKEKAADIAPESA